jgi:tetratricopeptide (TPR) repeat protein
MRNAKGFNWEGWQEAAKFCLDNKTNLKEALGWAQNAVSLPYIGQETFYTLRTLAEAQAANGLVAEAEATTQKAIDYPGVNPIELHGYGRELLARGEKDKALKVFEANARKHPNVWPVNVGLARGYAAVGRTQEALKYAKLAVQQAPDDVNKKAMQKLVDDLQVGKTVK